MATSLLLATKKPYLHQASLRTTFLDFFSFHYQFSILYSVLTYKKKLKKNIKEAMESRIHNAYHLTNEMDKTCRAIYIIWEHWYVNF